MLKLPTNRVARIGGQAAVLIALVGGTAAYAANDTTVQLSVDGVEEEVRVFGTTVDDVLEAADVDVSERDLVAPALGESVQDGSDVVVRHARLLTLTVDGATQEHWTTALSVEEALRDLDVRAEGARLSASRSTPLGRSGLDLEIITPKDVTVVADGRTTPVTTTAATVADVLTEAGLEHDADDRLSVPATEPVADGMTLKLARVVTSEVSETADVAFETKKVEDDDLFEGDTKVETRGAAGAKTITWTVTTVDGVEESRVKASEAVTRKPRTAVVLVGTKERPVEPAPPSSPAPADGSVWDRLAQCEAGGNWQINTGNGYYGGLQFSASSWRAVGGTGLPHQHSRATQIEMGERLKAKQGWGAWPSCSRKLGLR